jgi:hypothetical protein
MVLSRFGGAGTDGKQVASKKENRKVQDFSRGNFHVGPEIAHKRIALVRRQMKNELNRLRPTTGTRGQSERHCHQPPARQSKMYFGKRRIHDFGVLAGCVQTVSPLVHTATTKSAMRNPTGSGSIFKSVCHSEQSEESTHSIAKRPSYWWILRCAQNDGMKMGLETLPKADSAG